MESSAAISNWVENFMMAYPAAICSDESVFCPNRGFQEHTFLPTNEDRDKLQFPSCSLPGIRIQSYPSTNYCSSASDKLYEHVCPTPQIIQNSQQTFSEKSAADVQLTNSQINGETASKKRKKLTTTKRTRTAFTKHQVNGLQEEYFKDKYISRLRKSELASSLNLQEKQIKTWFQNKRSKERKLNKSKEIHLEKIVIPSGPISYSSQCSSYSAQNTPKNNYFQEVNNFGFSSNMMQMQNPIPVKPEPYAYFYPYVPKIIKSEPNTMTEKNAWGNIGLTSDRTSDSVGYENIAQYFSQFPFNPNSYTENQSFDCQSDQLLTYTQLGNYDFNQMVPSLTTVKIEPPSYHYDHVYNNSNFSYNF